jgi:HEAT repeat protein
MGQSAVPALAEALKDKNSVVRTNAAQALVKIGAEAQAAVPALAEALKDKEPGVRGHAAEALGRKSSAAQSDHDWFRIGPISSPANWYSGSPVLT